MKDNSNELANAPQHIKLAVDFIQMLEESNVEPSTAIAALEIVISDLKRQLPKAD